MPSYTITVATLAGAPLSTHTAHTLDAARVKVLEDALPCDMRLSQAVKAVDRLVASGRVEVAQLVIEMSPHA